MAELREHVAAVRLHAGRIMALHTDDELSSTRTVTPAEQKLGAHLTRLARSWADILPLATQLVHPAVTPRHLAILLAWLDAHKAAAAAAEAAGSALPAGPLMADPFAVPLHHVRDDQAGGPGPAGAERTSLAKLVTACAESGAARELAGRVVAVALGEAQLLTWLASIQERLAVRVLG